MSQLISNDFFAFDAQVSRVLVLLPVDLTHFTSITQVIYSQLSFC